MTPEESGLTNCARARASLDAALVAEDDLDRRDHVRAAVAHIKSAEKDLELLRVQQVALRNSVLNFYHLIERNYD